jgi:glycosyltransferase involved in cell wall biosynthesis
VDEFRGQAHISACRYSLIIATLDDQGDLARNLDSLTRLRGAPPFEIILIDQNGDDRLAGLTAAYAGRLRITRRRVDFRGASRARNLGVQLACGEWVAFPDDDCELFPDTLAEVERLAADPAIRVITGRTVDADGQANLLRWQRQPMVFDRWQMFGCLTEATLFVRRDLFLAAGGFDENFGPGARFPAAEGIELMNRLFDLIGVGKAYYSPRVAMRHPTKIPPWNRWAARRFHQYSIGDGALIAKSPRPHILNWGARRLVAACLAILTLRGWRSLAYAASLAGLLRGLITYRFCARGP